VKHPKLKGSHKGEGAVANPPLVSSYQPKNSLQRELSQCWNEAKVIILTGEPGTGKTSGAVGEALNDLLADRIRKIIFTRPPVPNGPGIGHLPGDVSEKMTPWLSSVSDSMAGFTNATFQKLQGKIEIADLGLVQGRTVRDAVLIVDEASNIYSRQLLVCLATRVGKNGKVVLCGDPKQSNLGYSPNPFEVFAADHATTPGVAVLTAKRSDQLRSGFVKDFLDVEDWIQQQRQRN
jgi:phosphate starvation-inducible protein PhoH and related proteins